MQVTITINGQAVSRDVEPRQLLVHFIRQNLGMTGTHWGCDTSNCGTCVVLMDGEPVKSCTVLAATADGRGPVDYKRHLAGVLTKRALRRATARALHREA